MRSPSTKRASLPPALRNRLWKVRVGTDIGTCYCCQRTVTFAGESGFEAGHKIAVANGGRDTLENLEVVCLPGTY